MSGHPGLTAAEAERNRDRTDPERRLDDDAALVPPTGWVALSATMLEPESYSRPGATTTGAGVYLTYRPLCV